MKKIQSLVFVLILLSVFPFLSSCSEKREEPIAYKPVIYLYPREKTKVTVKLDYAGELTTTYPLYNDGWTVIAEPDGQLKSQSGQEFNYLYWEGINHFESDMTKGFVIPGDETARFLEQSLNELGLTRKEANEFIVYWLPHMERNPYNLISFQESVYTDHVGLEVNPQPDTLIRVFMAWKPLAKPINIPEQNLSAPERRGFTVVEWGGTRVD